MELFLLWFGLACAVGYAAGRMGRSWVGWFSLAVIISPLLAGIFLAISGSKGIAAAPRDEIGNLITPDTHVHCPDCRELVRKDARKCKHCGTALIPQ